MGGFSTKIKTAPPPPTSNRINFRSFIASAKFLLK